MVSHEDLYNALKTIKQVCSDYENCKDCPLSNNQRCVLKLVAATPNNWELQPPPPPPAYHPIEI